MSQELLALITCPMDKSHDLARTLIEERLAACINIIPAVNSIFLWQGKLEEESEALLIAKTHVIVWEQFQQRVKELHPYDIPEIISFFIEKGYAPYLAWISSSLQRTS